MPKNETPREDTLGVRDNDNVPNPPNNNASTATTSPQQCRDGGKDEPDESGRFDPDSVLLWTTIPWRARRGDDGTWLKAPSLPAGFHYDDFAYGQPVVPFGQRDPDDQPGYVTSWRSGVIVFDMDAPDEALALLESAGIDLPETAEVSTGRDGGGRHLVYDGRALSRAEWPKQRNYIGLFDIKSNGFVAAPGAVHPSGRRYALARPGKPAPWPADLAKRLAMVWESQDRKKGVGAAGSGRNNALISYKGKLVKKGVPENSPEMDRLVSAFNARFSEPQTDSEVESTVLQVKGWEPGGQVCLPGVDCGGGKGPEVIRAVTRALCEDDVPMTFVASGEVVAIERVSGSPGCDGSLPLPVSATALTPALLASKLAMETRTFRLKKGKDGEPETEEFTPEARLLSSALAPRSWPEMRPLNGIVGSPVLKPDGSLLQDPGYDEATGLYLAPRVSSARVPVPPTAADVSLARETLLDRVLGDFPWCGSADKANYAAMLVTQVIRRRLAGSPVPFFPITATSQGSGKTLLATIAGSLFGKAAMVWTGDDEELRKMLTAVMRSQEGVVVFDNLPEGTVVRSGVLAKLLTDRTWGDRLLGGNVLGKFTNDRLWCATGNNLRLGGDMATRSVLIGLDPAMPHPERRSGFAIPDLESWIDEPDSQALLTRSLLTLAADWSAAGCPEADVAPMRQFSRWARACGGFLAHHGIKGFLANSDELEHSDDDSADWTQFLARWLLVLGPGWFTTSAVVATSGQDRWSGTFPTGRGESALSSKSLGKRLAGIRGRYHGSYVLNGHRDPADEVWTWQVKMWQESGQV